MASHVARRQQRARSSAGSHGPSAEARPASAPAPGSPALEGLPVDQLIHEVLAFLPRRVRKRARPTGPVCAGGRAWAGRQLHVRVVPAAAAEHGRARRVSRGSVRGSGCPGRSDEPPPAPAPRKSRSCPPAEVLDCRLAASARRSSDLAATASRPIIGLDSRA